MSERDRAMAEMIAQHTVARMLTAVKSKEFAEEMTETWSDAAYKIVGRAVVRLAIYIIGVSLLIASIKAGLIDRFIEGWTLRK